MGSYVNSNVDNRTFTTDYADAAKIYKEMYEEQNRFWWMNRLLLPAVEAAAQLTILRYQKSQYDEIEDRRVGYISSALGQFNDCMDEALRKMRHATDSIPEPAIYQPVSPSGEQLETISDNIEALRFSKEYTSAINEFSRDNALARMAVLNPKFYSMQEVTWSSIDKLIRGELPVGLTVEVMTRSCETALKNGRLGRHCRQTARNLGIVDYRVQMAARAEQRQEMVNQNANVYPVSSLGDVREFAITPQQRVTWGMQQALYIQNSMQNAYNACARKAPHLMNEVQLLIQKCQMAMQLEASKSGMVNSYVPNYAAIFNNQVRSVISGLGQGVISGMGGSAIATTDGYPGMGMGTGGFMAPNPPFAQYPNQSGKP